MTAELAWAQELPTKPGLYAWRNDEFIGGFGALRVTPVPDGKALLAYASDDPGIGPKYLFVYCGAEFLGPLPE